jgi:hypothetical protein
VGVVLECQEEFEVLQLGDGGSKANALGLEVDEAGDLRTREPDVGEPDDERPESSLRQRRVTADP